MWRHRLLISERGSALVGTVFGMLFLLTLAVGAVETILLVHARNVTTSAVHEGARAAVEVGGDSGRAVDVVRTYLQRTVGHMLRDDSVEAVLHAREDGTATAVVTVTGTLRIPGPIPAGVPVRLTGRASGRQIVP